MSVPCSLLICLKAYTGQREIGIKPLTPSSPYRGKGCNGPAVLHSISRLSLGDTCDVSLARAIIGKRTRLRKATLAKPSLVLQRWHRNIANASCDTHLRITPLPNMHGLIPPFTCLIVRYKTPAFTRARQSYSS